MPATPISRTEILDPTLARLVENFLFEETADLLERLEDQGYSRAELYMTLKRLDRGDPPSSKRWSPESHWDEHPVHASADWQHEVENEDTRQSYVQWVNSKLEETEPEELK